MVRHPSWQTPAVAFVSSVVALSTLGMVAPPAHAASPSARLTGHVVEPDGSPAVGARVRLEVEGVQRISGGAGTDGILIGTAVTDDTGTWTVIPSWPGQGVVKNPDGSLMVDAEATSADGTWDKLFNFNVTPPRDPGGAATVPTAADLSVVKGAAGGPVTDVSLSFSGVERAAAEVSGANVATEPKKTCDETHHVCYITGDPGPCRSNEPVSGWRTMSGDDATEKRWVPVQPISTTKHGHERYTFTSGRTTQMSIAYGGAGQHYAGGLAYSTRNSTDGGNDARAGTFFLGYFKQQWLFRKQRQWCVSQDPDDFSYNDLRDSGRRRFRAESWLGALTRQSASLSPWPCHDAYSLKVFKGQSPWVAKSSLTSWKGFFTLFGVSLESLTEDDSAHTLEVSADDTTKFCPDASKPVFQANRVQEE